MSLEALETRKSALVMEGLDLEDRTYDVVTSLARSKFNHFPRLLGQAKKIADWMLLPHHALSHSAIIRNGQCQISSGAVVRLNCSGFISDSGGGL
ncbi:hypothetical protein ACH5RR_023042 [Cinchona calisaya]|uniref:Uncharacterized protein n=1 Tax=Cinchona calisaya TaxID=153742 RepID=A0ABD2Z9I7_9GENT